MNNACRKTSLLGICQILIPISDHDIRYLSFLSLSLSLSLSRWRSLENTIKLMDCSDSSRTMCKRCTNTKREKKSERERERPPAYSYQSTAHVLNTPHVKALTAETAQVRIVRTRRKKLKISVLYFTSLCIQTLSLTLKQQCLFSYINTHVHFLPEYTHLNAHTWAKVSNSMFKDANTRSNARKGLLLKDHVYHEVERQGGMKKK